MTREHANDAQRVIPYATAERSGRCLLSPPLMNWVVIIVTFLSLFAFVVGLPPLAGALDYTRDIPITEALQYGWRKGVKSTLGDSYMIRIAMFLPLAATGATAFLALQRRLWARRVVLAINFLLPAFWVGPFVPVLVFAGPAVLFNAVIGRCDGEDWSEGWISYSAMGCWSLLWMMVAIVLFFDRFKSRAT